VIACGAAVGRSASGDAFRTGGATSSRRDFARVLAGSGIAIAAGSWDLIVPSAAGASPSATQDRAIFNFALLLEYLQASFYAEALAHGWPRGEIREYAEVVGDHERAHVRYLSQSLGRHARPRPTFDFGPTTRNRAKFLETARTLEDLAVAAYNGQAGNLTKPGLAAAVRIVSVEGRHSAWIRAIAGVDPAPRAADPGKGADEVTAALRRLRIR